MNCFNVAQFDFINGEYSAEASDLGLPPGAVPKEIGITHRSGVVSRFVFDRYTVVDGDIVSFNYRGRFDGTVKLFND